MKTVIVTAVGSFSGPAVIRCLKEQGWRVVGTEINPPELIAMSAETDEFVVLPRCDAGRSYIDAMKALILKEGASAVLPLTDAELDVLNEARGELLPAVLWVSPEEAVRRSRDKLLSRAAAEKAGARVIPTMLLSEVPVKDRVSALLDAPGLPLILKPKDGRSSQGLYRVRTEEELLKALREIRDGGREERFLVQPLIEGRVVTADVVRFPDGSCTAAPREEYVRTHNGAGLSVHVFRDPGLEAQCAAVARELGILGCVNFEFIHTEKGEYYFMECNPRFSGGVGFTAAAGDDVIRNHLACFGAAAEDPKRGTGPADCWIARKYVEVITKS